ncbi:MAG TPA: hypothetical protein VGE07_03770 [Herpetosiphonaceae bacterium]
MELRRYLTIIRRAWWIAVGVPLLVLAISLPGFRPDPQRYRAAARIAVTQAAIQPRDTQEEFPDLNSDHSWQAAQYIVDDLPAIIKSVTFANDVSAWIKSQLGLDVAPELIRASFEVEREHRILSMIITAPSEQEAVAIGQGAIAVIQQNGLRYWDRAASGGLAVGVLEMPHAAGPLSRWPQPVTRLALRLLLALAAGVGLTFLYHYLDRTVRERADLDTLDVPLLATIPRE